MWYYFIVAMLLIQINLNATFGFASEYECVRQTLGNETFEKKCKKIEQIIKANNVFALQEELTFNDIDITNLTKLGMSTKETISMLKRVILPNAMPFCSGHCIIHNRLNIFNYLMDQPEFAEHQENFFACEQMQGNTGPLTLHAVISCLSKGGHCPKKLLLILEKLLNHIKNPNVMCKVDGLCSFHHAIWIQHEEAVALFTKYGQGIDWNLKTQTPKKSELQIAPENCTPLDLAREKLNKATKLEEKQKAQRIFDLVLWVNTKPTLYMQKKPRLKKLYDMLVEFK